MTWTTLLVGVAIFVSAIGLDFADSSNTRAVAEGRPHAAARWSLLMYAFGTFGFFSVLEVSYWLAVPEAAGLYIGTLLAVRPPKAKRAPVLAVAPRPGRARRRAASARRHRVARCSARAVAGAGGETARAYAAEP